ncbi:MAG: hypothetical protein CMJ80_06060, partial [Planctomycetaceae bacterium]|nr:hypothetical protein [Planctomycetaceae bacterium]
YLGDIDAIECSVYVAWLSTCFQINLLPFVSSTIKISVSPNSKIVELAANLFGPLNGRSEVIGANR